MPIYTPVSQYNFDSDTDSSEEKPSTSHEFIDEEDENDELLEDFGRCFDGSSIPMSPLGASKRKCKDFVRAAHKTSHLMRRKMMMSNDEQVPFFDFASTNQSKRKWQIRRAQEDYARAELDGNLIHESNPMTIIQVKNPEKNVDAGKANTFATMSSSRKLCFLLSLLASFSMILIFVWVLPCGSVGQCASNASNHATSALTAEPSKHSWTRLFHEIALTSGLEVVRLPHVTDFSDRIVITGYRSNSEKSSQGLLAFDPESGSELWRRPMVSTPRQHSCDVINVFTSNDVMYKQCLVVGDHGLLALVDPKNGDVIWKQHHHIPLVNFSIPRRLPDIDGDGVDELISSCTVTFPSGITDHKTHLRNNLILISGREGKVIGSPYLVEICLDISSVNVTDSLNIRFDCHTTHGDSDQFELSLEEFYDKATGNEVLPPSVLNGPRSEAFSQFSRIGLDSSEAIKDSIHLDWTEIRSGCPECGVNVRLWDGFAHRPLWNKTWYNAVAFQPKSTRFETSRPDSPIEGFAFRLWEWDPMETLFRHHREPQKHGSMTERPRTLSPVNIGIEEEEDAERSPWSSQFNVDQNILNEDEDDNLESRFRPGVTNWISNLVPFGIGRRRLLQMQDQKPELFTRLLSVRESVIFVSLNHSSPRVSRVFSQEVIQRCSWAHARSLTCTPHYDNQTGSMVIVDDGPVSETMPRTLIMASPTLSEDSKLTTRLKKVTLTTRASSIAMNEEEVFHY